MKRKITIIGAGISGLYLAERLSASEFGSDSTITILETAKFPGGRFYSFRDSISGEITDNGQHLLSPAYSDFYGLLERAGLRGSVSAFEKNEIQFFSPRGDEFIMHLGSGSPGDFAFKILQQNYFSLNERIKIISLLNKIRKASSEEFGADTVSDYLIKKGQTAESIHAFWAPLTIAVMNTSPATAPMTLLAAVFRKMMTDGGLFGLKLNYLNTENSTLTEALTSMLRGRGVEIFYGAGVRKILINDGLAIGTEFSDGSVLPCDMLISTVPPHSLKKILTSDILASNGFKNLMFYEDSQIISAYFWYKDKFNFPEIFAMLDAPFHWGFNRRKMSKTVPPEGGFKSLLALTVSNCDDLNEYTKYEIREMFAQSLFEGVLEFKKHSQPTHWRLVRERHATFAANPQLETCRLEQETDIPNFYLAGDWTATGLPATIEGACLSAEKVFRLISEEY